MSSLTDKPDDWEPTPGYRRFVPLTAEEEKRLRAKPRLIPSAPHHAYERHGFGVPVEPDPSAVELRAILPALPGTADMLPQDIPLPPSWRDPAKMHADVDAAIGSVPSQPAKVTIFRAISYLADHATVMEPDMLDALAAGLGVECFVRTRTEAVLVRERERFYDHDELAYEGETQTEIASGLGIHPRTVRRRKKVAPYPDEWPNAAAVIADAEKLVALGEWDRPAKVRLFDACLWFTNRARPLPVQLWWAVACAFRLAKGPYGNGRFTDKAIPAIWSVPTTSPATLPEAARLRAADPSLSNRKIAESLGVDDGVINRLASVKKHRNADTGLSVLDHAAWTERIWMRWRSKA